MAIMFFIQHNSSSNTLHHKNKNQIPCPKLLYSAEKLDMGYFFILNKKKEAAAIIQSDINTDWVKTLYFKSCNYFLNDLLMN